MKEQVQVAESAAVADYKLIKLSTAAEREDISMATLWNYVRNDPDFPPLVYDANGRARISERLHTIYLAKKYSAQPSARAAQARAARARKLERAAA